MDLAVGLANDCFDFISPGVVQLAQHLALGDIVVGADICLPPSSSRCIFGGKRGRPVIVESGDAGSMDIASKGSRCGAVQPTRMSLQGQTRFELPSLA